MQQNAHSPDTKLLTRSQVVREFNIPQHFLEDAGPPRLKLGHRTVRYRRADVEEWLTSRRIPPKPTGAVR